MRSTLMIAAVALLLSAGCTPKRSSTAPPSAGTEIETGTGTKAPYDVDSEGRYPQALPPKQEADEEVPAPTGIEIGLEPVEEVDLMVPPAVENEIPPAGEGEPPGEGAGPGDGYRLGYRIQILATDDLERARAVRDEAEARFGVPGHIEYEESLYKVRLGDFGSRGEALGAIGRVKDGGYPDSWIVTTTVRAPPRESPGGEH